MAFYLSMLDNKTANGAAASPVEGRTDGTTEATINGIAGTAKGTTAYTCYIQ